jgi:hypothetical protein
LKYCGWFSCGSDITGQSLSATDPYSPTFV